LWMWTIADELTLDRPTTLLLRSSASVYSWFSCCLCSRHSGYFAKTFSVKMKA
jgi:hypothetical protein